MLQSYLSVCKTTGLRNMETLLVCAAFTAKKPSVLIRSSTTTQRYIQEVLEEHVLPYCKSLPSWFFTRLHVGRVVSLYRYPGIKKHLRRKSIIALKNRWRLHPLNVFEVLALRLSFVVYRYECSETLSQVV